MKVIVVVVVAIIIIMIILISLRRRRLLLLVILRGRALLLAIETARRLVTHLQLGANADEQVEKVGLIGCGWEKEWLFWV